MLDPPLLAKMESDYKKLLNRNTHHVHAVHRQSIDFNSNCAILHFTSGGAAGELIICFHPLQHHVIRFLSGDTFCQQ